MAWPPEARPDATRAGAPASSRVPRRAYAVAAAIAVLVAGVGGLATDLGPWYRGLVQPPWKPPDIVFGPVWTLLYTLTAWAGARAWWHARAAAQADEAAAAAGRRRQRRLLAGFLLNALLNVLWSVLFFKAQRPDWALVEIVLLTASVLWLIPACAQVDRLAARLLLPYLVWVLFAATVNAGVLRLNPVGPGA
ncbi:MAG: TspO/MBR family protein [Betaproteobacteria bacterium]